VGHLHDQLQSGRPSGDQHPLWLYQNRLADRSTDSRAAVRRRETAPCVADARTGDGLAYEAAEVVREPCHAGPSLPHRYRPGSARSAAHPHQAVLRLQYAIRLSAELGYLSDLYRDTWRAAGHEPPSVRAGSEGGLGPQLPDRLVHQVGPKELLLSRSAQELPDQSVRSSLQPRRLAGDRDGGWLQTGRH